MPDQGVPFAAHSSPDATKCLVPKCPRPATYARGLCHDCYQSAYRLVVTGQTSWFSLEAREKVLPDTDEHRFQKKIDGRTDWFLEGEHE